MSNSLIIFVAEPVDPDLGGGDEQVNLANALDLSESEDEEEMENIFGDFAQQDGDMDLVSSSETLGGQSSFS